MVLAVVVVPSPSPALTLLPPPVRLPLLHDRPLWHDSAGASVALLPPPLRWGGLWAVPVSTQET